MVYLAKSKKEVRIITDSRHVIEEAVLFGRDRTGELSEWEIWQYTEDCVNLKERYPCRLPIQVHEVLVNYKQIQNPVVTHQGEESLYVSRRDWIYRMEFDMDLETRKYVLKCRGLDTIVDLYLNGKKIGSHRDMFYPFQADIQPEKTEKNILLFHFWSPVKYLEKMRELHGQELIPPAHYIRKAPHDFEDFLGIKPYFASVGIFDEVIVEELGDGTLTELSVTYELSEDLKRAEVKMHVAGELYGRQKAVLHYSVRDWAGELIFGGKREICEGIDFETDLRLEISEIDLWWPNGYGSQPLYSCEVSLEFRETISTIEKRIGFRKTEFKDTFELFVNHVRVRLWGANLVPVNGMTHCFDEERAGMIIRRAKDANMNMLRFWGGGEPYPDKMYTMADEAGLMVWGEFFHKWGMYPEDEEYMELYRNEASYMLRTFCHHPSLVMWCGGNESHMGAAIDHPYKNYIGEKIFEMYERMCHEIDPERYFQYDSPSGGIFTNDPRKGDFHGWNHLWYVPYDQYPAMFSENSRVSPPVLRSLKKYISDPKALWPDGFISRVTKHGESLLPPAWMELKTGPEPYTCSPVEQFYDADSPKELIYRCQAAHGHLMKRIGERLKRGRPVCDKDGKNRCNGQLIWKLNDSWPQIFCSLLDYDLEGGIPYYTIKRVFSQIQVSFDMEEHITIWVVNDSRYTFQGTLEFTLFDPKENVIRSHFEQGIEIGSGRSDVICDLDYLNQFERNNILYACLKEKEGQIVARNYEFLEIERNLYFPDAKLTLEKEGDAVVISTDQFARCIELTGDLEEARFIFEDNYFDLMPFEKRRVGIQTTEEEFTIKAKAFYSSSYSKIEF